ncbi:MAG: hypothetical protein R2778_02815 [Saprospiraceae bacterium]
MRYFHLGKVISHEQAASIIGQHFTNVQDKLLNILQLKQQSSNAIYKELINASINQKSDEIRLVPFQSAIDLGKNRKYLRCLASIMLFLFLMLGAPYIIREGSMRLWNSGTKYSGSIQVCFEYRRFEKRFSFPIMILPLQWMEMPCQRCIHCTRMYSID